MFTLFRRVLHYSFPIIIYLFLFTYLLTYSFIHSFVIDRLFNWLIDWLSCLFVYLYIRVFIYLHASPLKLSSRRWVADGDVAAAWQFFDDSDVAVSGAPCFSRWSLPDWQEPSSLTSLAFDATSNSTFWKSVSTEEWLRFITTPFTHAYSRVTESTEHVPPWNILPAVV